MVGHWLRLAARPRRRTVGAAVAVGERRRCQPAELSRCLFTRPGWSGPHNPVAVDAGGGGPQPDEAPSGNNLLPIWSFVGNDLPRLGHYLVMQDATGTEALSRRRTREERFRLLYAAHADAIYAYGLSRLGHAQTAAEDFTADVFTVVWRRMDAVPPSPDDRIYIYRIAYRQLKNQQRSLWRRLRLQRRLSFESDMSQAVVGEPTLALELTRSRVRSAIGHLPISQREALLLVLWDGFTHAEAADLLGCTANAVAIRLHKARKNLSALLDTEPEVVSDPRPLPILHSQGE